MNYRKIYFDIIEKRKNESYDGYTEVHHILPRSLGGSDDKSNLVALSAREHFICHLLLTKMYKENSVEWKKCVRAFMMMFSESKNQKRHITSKQYQKLREDFSRIQSQEQSGSGNSQYGTMWIYSMGLRKCKKIKKTEQIPEGWQKGYVVSFDSLFKRLETKKKQKIEKETLENQLYEEKVKQLTEWYNIYKDVGFDEFVRITGYKHSKPNLVTAFSRHVPDFVPQNGKPRGRK